MPEIVFDLKIVIDSSLALFIGILLALVIYKIGKKIGLSIMFMFLFIIDIILNILNFTIASDIMTISLFSLITCFFVAYSSKLSSMFKKNRKKNIKQLDNEGKEEFYDVINSTVCELSSSKTGALLTFEKNENLDSFISKGKQIGAKVSNDLLRTIFYVGTPLHDGAVIIRGNVVEAASVYYTPTTKAMLGKFGARHRAALGFCEKHDSLTVVVSEETGRISFAYKGELIHTTQEQFLKRFKEFLEEN